MSEIGDLIAILGAVDGAVHRGEEHASREQVAALVKAYREGDRFGWYDSFAERDDNEGLPGFEQAMRNLGRPTRFAGMLPRRLLVVALAARVFPQWFGPDGDAAEASLRALVIPGIVAALPLVPTPPAEEPPDPPDFGDPSLRSQGEELLRALADPSRLSRIEEWHEFLESNSHILSPQLASLPAPCTTTVIDPPTGGDDGVVVLQTGLCVGGVDLAALSAGFLDPRNWPGCSPWWCHMLPAPGGAPGLKRYLEVVAADCPNRIFEVAVFLDFATAIDRATRKVVTYNMSPDQSGMVGGLGANDAVEVDRGVIDVRREGDHCRVETTKRIRFAQPVDADALAVIACVVGYGDVAVDVICDCSGGSPQPVDCDPDEGAAAGRATPAVDRLVDLARKCVTEAGDEARRIAGRLDEGSYTPEAAAEDAARTAALALRGLATLATTVVEAVKDVVGPPAVAPSTLESKAFAFRAAIPDDSRLALLGPLESPYGERIDVGRVEFRPPALSTGGEFRLSVDIGGLEGSVYTGVVRATNPATGGDAASIDVDVIVP
jgi:hypothetical protein